MFVVDSCRGDSKETVYGDYMNQVRAVAVDSQAVGTQFTDLLNQPGIKLTEIETATGGARQRGRRQAVSKAQDINPPGRCGRSSRR